MLTESIKWVWIFLNTGGKTELGKICCGSIRMWNFDL